MYSMRGKCSQTNIFLHSGCAQISLCFVNILLQFIPGQNANKFFVREHLLRRVLKMLFVWESLRFGLHQI